jgi:hypothetical protein
MVGSVTNGKAPVSGAFFVGGFAIAETLFLGRERCVRRSAAVTGVATIAVTPTEVGAYDKVAACAGLADRSNGATAYTRDRVSVYVDRAGNDH